MGWIPLILELGQSQIFNTWASDVNSPTEFNRDETNEIS